MTIKKLKEMIADLPDDMRVYADDGVRSRRENSEFVCIAAGAFDNMAVFQTKHDIDVKEELRAMGEVAMEEGWGDGEFFAEALERGYKPEDFPDPAIVEWKMENQYGLM